MSKLLNCQRLVRAKRRAKIDKQRAQRKQEPIRKKLRGYISSTQGKPRQMFDGVELGRAHRYHLKRSNKHTHWRRTTLGTYEINGHS